jgi:surface antigen
MRVISLKKCLPVLLLCLVVGCETTDPGGPPVQRPPAKAAIGGLGGAAAGGLLAAALGGRPEGIAAGVILGGLVGGAIGDRLDAADRRQAQQATVRALESTPSGASVPWRNPDSGNSGTVTPVQTYQTHTGQYCREYQQTVTIGGQQHQSYGTACRQPDGSWRIMN